MRIGFGIDTHELIKGKFIRLCGIDIPSIVTVKAHSDGDIIFHAVADAILGAIAEGDIGDHFPDTDSKNLNLDSSIIVKDAIKKALSKGFVLNNLDITLLLEKPKIYEYKKDMIDNILKLFRESTPDDVINQDMFNIKASTSESLGYIGRGEGVTCYCIASLKEI
jgi:2-C-methyl-D-erythritol 2,4-cyclodiphosphate synthase|tara:strand:- start:12205 stop:12699 length:495 start_codon:yes stop_codon:yes gene_type:complete